MYKFKICYSVNILRVAVPPYCIKQDIIKRGKKQMLALHIVSALALIVWTVGGGIYIAKRIKACNKPNENKMTKYDDKY